MMYTFCKLFNKLLYTFCIQNLAAIVLLIWHTKCIQKFVEMRDTFCIHLVNTSCIHLVQFLYTKYIITSLECIEKFYNAITDAHPYQNK